MGGAPVGARALRPRHRPSAGRRRAGRGEAVLTAVAACCRRRGVDPPWEGWDRLAGRRRKGWGDGDGNGSGGGRCAEAGGGGSGGRGVGQGRQQRGWGRPGPRRRHCRHRRSPGGHCWDGGDARGQVGVVAAVAPAGQWREGGRPEGRGRHGARGGRRLVDPPSPLVVWTGVAPFLSGRNRSGQWALAGVEGGGSRRKRRLGRVGAGWREEGGDPSIWIQFYIRAHM